jgi:hypothetical protein
LEMKRREETQETSGRPRWICSRWGEVEVKE